MTCGIYLLSFKDLNKPYIGQSNNIESRYSGHLYKLKNGLGARKVQEAYNIYGTPTLSILEECIEANLSILEKVYITKFDAVESGLNTSSDPTSGPKLCGEDAIRSQYSNKVYEDVFNILVDCPEIPITEVSEFLKVPDYIIRQISAGSSHLWLKDKYPDKYTKLVELRNNRRSIQNSPNGKAKHAKEVYYKVLCMLITKVPTKDISKVTGVSQPSIRDIKNLYRNKWLESAYPVEYAKLKSLK